MISLTRLSLAARMVQRLNLRLPALFPVFGSLTLFNLMIPDLIPFANEIGLGAPEAIIWKMEESIGGKIAPISI